MEEKLSAAHIVAGLLDKLHPLTKREEVTMPWNQLVAYILGGIYHTISLGSIHDLFQIFVIFGSQIKDIVFQSTAFNHSARVVLYNI